MSSLYIFILKKIKNKNKNKRKTLWRKRADDIYIYIYIYIECISKNLFFFVVSSEFYNNICFNNKRIITVIDKKCNQLYLI